MKKIILFLVFLMVPLIITLAYAANYGRGTHGRGLYGIGVSVPPQINITKIGPTSAKNISVIGSYGTDGTISNITVVMNDSYTVSANINTTSKKWNATVNLTEGWNKFYVLANDTSGNRANVTSSSQGASILSDTTNPAINLTAPKNTSSVANNSLITFKVSDLSLTGAFYTINDGSTRSFNGIYQIRVNASEWVNGINYVIVNATDDASNVETKNYTFSYSNTYDVALNSSINVVVTELNQTNSTVNNLKDSAVLQSIVNNSAVQISVQDYNKTLQLLNVTAKISDAVNSMQTLYQDILSANSTNQSNATKIATINDKLNQISIIKNTTILSVDVNLFNPNLTVQVDSSTKSNVTQTLIDAAGGLSATEKESFKQASAALQDKTTILNKAQVLTQTFLNGRTQNTTLFEKNITLTETQSGQFYVNEIIDKNITGNNNLKASTDITNKVPQPLTIVTDDPAVRWTFSDSSSADVAYSIDNSVDSDSVDGSKTVITTVPTSSGGGSGGETGGGGGGETGGGTSGGGGGIPIKVVTDFSIDKNSLKVVLKQGQTRTETLRIKNTGTSIFDVKTILVDIDKFIVSTGANEITTTLQPNEEKTIELNFKALQGQKPDIYPGKIKFKSPSTEKELVGIVEVDSAEPLFDASIQVLPSSKEVYPGEQAIVEVNLVNIRGFGRVDVDVEYIIKDLQGNDIVTQHETLAVETQAKFTKSLLLPSDLKPGTYVASVRVTYGDSVGTGSDLFEVKAKTIKLFPVQIKDYRTILIIVGIVILLGGVMFSAYKFGYLRTKAPKTEQEQVKQLQQEEQTQKLKNELEALEKAHAAGFISDESYQSSKKRLEEKINK